MAEKKLAGWAQSSSSSEEISNRIKGVVLALSGLIIYFGANLFGVQLSAGDVAELASLLGIMGGALWGVWGAGMALVKWVATVR